MMNFINLLNFMASNGRMVMNNESWEGCVE